MWLVIKVGRWVIKVGRWVIKVGRLVPLGNLPLKINSEKISVLENKQSTIPGI